MGSILIQLYFFSQTSHLRQELKQKQMKTIFSLFVVLLLSSTQVAAWSPHRTPHRFNNHRFNTLKKTEIQAYSLPKFFGLSASHRLSHKSAIAFDFNPSQQSEYEIWWFSFVGQDRIRLRRTAIGINYIRFVELKDTKWSEFTYAFGARYANTRSSYSAVNNDGFGKESLEENMYFHVSGQFKKYRPKHEWHLGLRMGYYKVSTFNAPTSTPYNWAGKGTFSIDPSVTYLHTFTENSPISLSAELTAGFPFQELTDRIIEEGDTFRSVSTTKYTPFTIAALLSLNYQF